MVADKFKSDTNVNDEFGCRDSRKITSNLSVSPSDECKKCKSDEECCIDQSFDSSTKDESDEEPKNLNTTYICNRPSVIYSCDGDVRFKKIQKSNECINLNFNEKSETCNCLRNTEWKNRNFFGLSKDFDINYKNFEFPSLKMSTEQATTEDSIKNYVNQDDSLLIKLRNYLADYQELRGTSREEYEYVTLIESMGQTIGHCLLALFYVLVNIIPIFEIILHIVRFIFDKIINIKNTSDIQQILFKLGIFFLEILSIYICLIFIFDFIVLPAVCISSGIILKIMFYV